MSVSYFGVLLLRWQQCVLSHWSHCACLRWGVLWQLWGCSSWGCPWLVGRTVMSLQWTPAEQAHDVINQAEQGLFRLVDHIMSCLSLSRAATPSVCVCHFNTQVGCIGDCWI